MSDEDHKLFERLERLKLPKLERNEGINDAFKPSSAAFTQCEPPASPSPVDPSTTLAERLNKLRGNQSTIPSSSQIAKEFILPDIPLTLAEEEEALMDTMRDESALHAHEGTVLNSTGLTIRLAKLKQRKNEGRFAKSDESEDVLRERLSKLTGAITIAGAGDNTLLHPENLSTEEQANQLLYQTMESNRLESKEQGEKNDDEVAKGPDLLLSSSNSSSSEMSESESSEMEEIDYLLSTI